MIRLLPLIALLLILAACESIVITTPNYPYPEPAIGGEKTIVDMTGHASVPPMYQQANGIRGINLTQGGIDNDRDGVLDDETAFRRMIRRRVPEGFRGFVALDWEEPIFSALKKPKSSREFKDAIQQLINVVQIGRAERPTAKWGFYGLPVREYWKRNAAWESQSRALVDLIRECDWLGPSVYNMYKSPAERSREETRTYAREHARMALELGRLAGGVPVYPWVTHRYHPSNKTWGQHVISEAEFRTILAGIRDAEHRNEGVAGVIWWAADEWYDERDRIPDDIDGDRDAYFRDLHRRFMLILGEWATE